MGRMVAVASSLHTDFTRTAHREEVLREGRHYLEEAPQEFLTKRLEDDGTDKYVKTQAFTTVGH